MGLEAGVISRRPAGTGTVVGAMEITMTWCLMFRARSGVGAGRRGETEMGHKSDVGNEGPALGIMAEMVVVDETERGGEVGVERDMIDDAEGDGDVG